MPNAQEPDEGASQNGDASVAPVDLRHPIQLQVSIFDQVSDAIIITDLEGKIVFWNKQTTVLTQVSDRDAVDKSIFDIVVPQIRAEKGMEIVDEFNTTGHWKGEITFKRKDGSTFIASITSSLLKDDSGTPIGIIGLGRDVTESKRTEAALKEYSEELKRSNEELEHFANIASHDLGEPLRMISNYLNLLERRYKGKVLDEKAEEFIHFAIDGASRMGHLIDDLLEYSRVERKGKPFGPVDMNTVVTNVLKNMRVAIDESGAEAVVEHLPMVWADEVQMGQVLQNLISNAIKFHGPDPPKINIYARQGTNEWTISVKDNGIGIDPKCHDKLFQMFQRLHTRDAYPGTGIGLAISKKIIERHNGRIWIESDGKSGSTFSFTVPKST